MFHDSATILDNSFCVSRSFWNISIKRNLCQILTQIFGNNFVDGSFFLHEEENFFEFFILVPGDFPVFLTFNNIPKVLIIFKNDNGVKKKKKKVNPIPPSFSNSS